MNEKVILKISRHIINYFYPDLSKVEILEKVYCNRSKDVECQNILNLVNNLKKANELTYAEIINMYSNLPNQKEKISLNQKAMLNFFRYIRLNEPIRIFKYILSKNIFYDFSFPMAILIFNKMYYKENNNMIVVFLFTYPFLKTKSHKKYTIFQNYFEQILQANIKYEKVNKVYEIKEIQQKIQDFSSMLLISYNVKRIYLFGSYVKKNNNCYSDIDFFFICEKIMKLSSLRVQTIFKKELEKIFNSSCDVHIHDNSQEYNKFEKNILNEALLLLDVDNKMY